MRREAPKPGQWMERPAARSRRHRQPRLHGAISRRHHLINRLDGAAPAQLGINLGTGVIRAIINAAIGGIIVLVIIALIRRA